MRLIIDKDISEIKVLQESYNNKKPTFKVIAVENGEKFVYGKKLSLSEARNTVFDLAFDPQFNAEQAEIVSESSNKLFWDSTEKTVVTEGFFDKLKGALKGAWNITKQLTGQFSKDMLNKWRNAHYFTKDGQITGLGYKVMTGQAKNTVPADTDDKKGDISQVWEVAKSNVTQGLKKQGMTINGQIEAFVKNDKEPIQLSATVVDKDGNEQKLMLSQDGKVVNGDGENGKEGGDGNDASANNTTANTKKITPDQAQKNPKAALGNLATRVANIEKEIGLASESWNFNNEHKFPRRELMERLAIRRFFNEVNDPSVKEIKFVKENGTTKTYKTSEGSTSYSDFKKDIREATEKASKTKFLEYKVTFESASRKSKLNGFKFSDFGMDDDFDSNSKTIIVRECISREKPKKTVVVKENENAKKVDEAKDDEDNGEFSLNIDVADPQMQIQQLLASINKYDVVDADASLDDNHVGVYPDAENPEETDIIQEAEGDDEGGGDDAGGGDDDPFAGGGDEGGGDDADPFAGGDDDAGGGDEGGGDDAGGGGDDPFAGGDDAGGDAEGGDAAPADDASGEPQPDSAVNTDAQGNQKSQYNINVTRPFNAEDDFSLNEDETEEFFGKIDQLVKIPDMDNYALYLYQITPENLNLDDVHYIQSLYELSVKLGLLEDIYADSNLLDKYSSYKYSVIKNGDEQDGTTDGENGLTIQESSSKTKKNKNLPDDICKTQDDNKRKLKQSLEYADDRRGPKWENNLNKDEFGADKPVIVDLTKEDWKKKDTTLLDGTSEGQFHGLGWIATFKAMQFGSPRYLSLYIKRTNNDKPEKQCEDYLKRLSYTEIEFVNIDEVDPYEYVYRTHTGMKTPETVRTEKYANEEVPVTYFESSSITNAIPKDVKRDIKRVISKLNSEIRNTKQFNFIKECGIEKPQINLEEFINHYKTAKVDETISETTYKFIFQPNDNLLSRMMFSNLKEKLFKYFGTFATKYNMECGCEATPKQVIISFMRSDFGGDSGLGYDFDAVIDTTETPEYPNI